MYGRLGTAGVGRTAGLWFAAIPDAEVGAKIFVHRTLGRWDLSILAHSAGLAVAELVRRSLAQTTGDYRNLFHVRLARSELLYMAVWDPFDAPSPAVPNHGLMVVPSVCDRWGYKPVGDGTLMWCELACTAAVADPVAGSDIDVLLRRVLCGLQRLG
jgi:hypothetical protein